MSFAKNRLREKNKDIPEEIYNLKGKTITDIGFIDEEVEGGLTVDYKEGDTIKRLVLGYNELGTWLIWHGTKDKDNPEDILRDKIRKTDNPEGSVKIVDDPLKRCYRLYSNSKEILKLTLPDIKLLPDNIKKYFKVCGEDRFELLKTDEEYSVVNYPDDTQEEKLGNLIWANLYSWSYCV
jgi:hypothetical protein